MSVINGKIGRLNVNLLITSSYTLSFNHSTLTGVRPLQYVEVTIFFYRVSACDVTVAMLVYLDKEIEAMLCPQLFFWELNFILIQTFSFVLVEKHGHVSENALYCKDSSIKCLNLTRIWP